MENAINTHQRPFGFWTASALVVGGMVGAGIFMLPTSMAAFGSIGILAWIISISGALGIAYVMARMSRAMPQATGAIAITGEVLGALPGVLVGWSYWVSAWAANAAIGIAATSYLAVFVPALNATPLRGALTAVTLIWLLTLLNLAGAAAAGRFQVVTTAIKLIPLFVVAAIVAMLGFGDTSTVATPAAIAPSLLGLGAAVTLTLFPLLGFESASVAAARVRHPERNVMRASMLGTALTGLLYIIVCSGIVMLLPRESLQASSSPFALFFDTYVGHGSALIVSAFAAIAAIGALNAWVLMVGEVPLGMARAGLLPRWFGKVNQRDAPVRVLLLSSVLASLLVLANASKSLSGIFEFIALLTTCAALWLYIAICIASLLRGITVVPAALGLIFTLWAMWSAGLDASGLSLLLMLTAVPIYFLRFRGTSPAS